MCNRPNALMTVIMRGIPPESTKQLELGVSLVQTASVQARQGPPRRRKTYAGAQFLLETIPWSAAGPSRSTAAALSPT